MYDKIPHLSLTGFKHFTLFNKSILSLYETHETEAKCKTNIQCLCPSITNILWSDSYITMPMMALNSNVKLDKAKCYIKATNFFVDPAMIKVSMYRDICI